MSAHYGVGPDTPQTREAVWAAPTETVEDFMGRCDVEPSDWDGCLACFSYLVVQHRDKPTGYTSDVLRRLGIDVEEVRP